MRIFHLDRVSQTTQKEAEMDMPDFVAEFANQPNEVTRLASWSKIKIEPEPSITLTQLNRMIRVPTENGDTGQTAIIVDRMNDANSSDQNTNTSDRESARSEDELHRRRESNFLAILNDFKKTNEAVLRTNEAMVIELKKMNEKQEKIIELLQLRRFNNSNHECLLGVQPLVPLETVLNDPKWDEWARRGPSRTEDYMKTLALELATRVFFGDDVLIQSNAVSSQGRKQKVLDPYKVLEMRSAVKRKIEPDLIEEVFEEKWKKIMSSTIQNRCRNLRNNVVKSMTSSELILSDIS